MSSITFPLTIRMQEPAVGDLQDAMQLLLERSVLLRDNENDHRKLSAALRCEIAESLYGRTTGGLVNLFQQQQRIQPTGKVDEQTALALNAVLEEMGVLDPLPPTPPTGERGVEGQVRREDGLLRPLICCKKPMSMEDL